MKTVHRDLIAVFAARVWAAAIALAVIPIYVRFLGVEAYGLIGFYATLHALLMGLDMGLTATVTRDLAQQSAVDASPATLRNLARTYEVIYWLAAVLVGALLLLAAGPIARYWIEARQLPEEVIRHCISMMAAIVIVQWPLSFYFGALLGLNQQPAWSAIYAGGATLRSVGAILVLWLVEDSIFAFFSWHLIATLVQAGAAMALLWSRLPGRGWPRIQWSALRGSRRFAGGMMVLALVSLLLAQIDKIVVSRLLSLEEFGLYMIAASLAAGLYIVVSPFYSVFFPRFSAMIALGQTELLKPLYHRACQLLSVALLPLAVVLALFPREILLLWTGSAETAGKADLILTFLALGTAMNGLMNLPYALQVASGWTRLLLLTNTFALMILVPLTVELATRKGGAGAALGWMLLNAAYIGVTVQLMHRRLLRGEQWRWYGQDVGLPMLAALSVAALIRGVLHESASPVLLTIGVALLTAYAAAALATPNSAQLLRGWIRRRKDSLSNSPAGGTVRPK